MATDTTHPSLVLQFLCLSYSIESYDYFCQTSVIKNLQIEIHKYCDLICKIFSMTISKLLFVVVVVWRRVFERFPWCLVKCSFNYCWLRLKVACAAETSVFRVAVAVVDWKEREDKNLLEDVKREMHFMREDKWSVRYQFVPFL